MIETAAGIYFERNALILAVVIVVSIVFLAGCVWASLNPWRWYP